jgi:hypothetical protein
MKSPALVRVRCLNHRVLLEDPLKESRDERDFKAELEIKTPTWLPGVRIAASFQRLWDRRGEDYANRMVSLAGVDIDQLEARLSKGDQFADLFLEGGRRVVESGDEVVRDTITRLVAAALRDDARIHDASYFMKKLLACDALHVRAIWAIPHRRLDPPLLEEQDRYSSEVFQKNLLQNAQWLEKAADSSLDRIARKCFASKLLVRAALRELESMDFACNDRELGGHIAVILNVSDNTCDLSAAKSLTAIKSALAAFDLSPELLGELNQSYEVHKLTALGVDLCAFIHEIDTANDRT